MQISVTVEVSAKGASELRLLADRLAGEVVTAAVTKAAKGKANVEDDDEEETVAPRRRGRGRPKKEEVDEEEVDEEEVDEEEVDEEEVDEEEVDEEEVDEEDYADAAQQKKIRAALSAYSKKHKRDKAVAILRKFGGASDRVLKKDVTKLLKALKV